MLKIIAVGLALSLAQSALAQGSSDVQAAPEDVQVAPEDLLAVQVLDWDPVAAEVRLWEEVSGEYRVGPDGTIAVPFAGRVVAAGRTPDEIAAAIFAALRQRLALASPPDVTVNITAQRPVIVTGDVRAPGAYDFIPGMLALEAVAIAGGVGDLVPDGTGSLRDVVSLRTSLAVLRVQELRLLARQARLRAEIDGRMEIVLEGEAPPEPDWPTILGLEEQLMRVRADGLDRELAALDGQSELFAAEIEALEQRTESLNRQRDLASEAAANADDLVERGLAAGGRLVETQNALAGIETRILDTSTAILRARQNLAQADRERIGLQDLRRAEILEALQEVDSRLRETREQIAGQLAAIRAVRTGRPLELEVEPTITVMRRQNGGLTRVENAGLLPLRPGDLIEVSQPVELSTGLPSGALSEADDLLGSGEAPGAIGVASAVPVTAAPAEEVSENPAALTPAETEAGIIQPEPLFADLSEAPASAGTPEATTGTLSPPMMELDATPTPGPLGPTPPLRPLSRPASLD